MTRKHFIAIAAIISEQDLSSEQRQALAEDFARFLAGTNSNFDRQRFMTAAGV